MKFIKILLVTLFFAGFYACNNGNEAKKTNSVSNGEAEKSVMPASQLAEAERIIIESDQSKIEPIDAETLFKGYCGICHGQKGNMSINGSKVLTETNTTLAERVAQIYFGKGTMTPFKGVLEDDQIVAVAKYIDNLKKS